jgi:hypothetical protein
MERNELVHLVTADDPNTLNERERRAALVDASGAIHTYVLYLAPRRPPGLCWD